MIRVKDSIAVLCRGNSLHNIDQIPLVDEYIIVNRFGDELEDEKLSIRLKDENITHVLSLVPGEPDGMIKRNHYKDFNINKIVVPYIKETVPRRYPKIEGKNGLIEVSVLNDEHKKYMYKRGERPDGSKRYAYSYPTSGVAAVAHSTIDYGKKNIFIIGLDFYEAKYAFGYTEDGYNEWKSVEESLKWGEDPNMMRNFLTNFMSLHEETHFNIITCSDYSCNLENVEILNVLGEL